MKYIVLLLAIIIFSETTRAQTSEITGRVIDKSNQLPINNVAVSVIQNGVILYGSESSDDGFFRVIKVEVGTYSVRINQIGYETLLLDNVVVNSGSPTNIFAELEIVSTDEIVVEDDRFVMPGDLANSFKTLRYEEIRRTPGGFEDIGRVIQTLPGVFNVFPDIRFIAFKIELCKIVDEIFY